MKELNIISNPVIEHPLKYMFVKDVIAKLVKEKGFNEPCFAYYQLSHTGDDYSFNIVGEYKGYTDLYINYVGTGLTNLEMERNPVGRLKQCFTAPMYHQVSDWLLIKHNIILDIRHTPMLNAIKIITDITNINTL